MGIRKLAAVRYPSLEALFPSKLSRENVCKSSIKELGNNVWKLNLSKPNLKTNFIKCFFFLVKIILLKTIRLGATLLLHKHIFGHFCTHSPTLWAKYCKKMLIYSRVWNKHRVWNKNRGRKISKRKINVGSGIIVWAGKLFLLIF